MIQTIYVNTGSLYSIDTRSGAIRWILPNLVSYFCAPAVGASGNIYVGSDRIFSIISLDGTIHCSRAIATSQSLFASPTIGPNQRVYIGHMNGLFYAFPGYSLSSVSEEDRNKGNLKLALFQIPQQISQPFVTMFR